MPLSYHESAPKWIPIKYEKLPLFQNVLTPLLAKTQKKSIKTKLCSAETTIFGKWDLCKHRIAK